MLLLCFAAVLLVSVLVSHVAHKTILSTAVIFLLAGFLLGDGVLGVISVTATDGTAFMLAELALFAVLFNDGMKVGIKDLAAAWKLPGRALAFGLPFTLLITAALAYFLTPLGIVESLLLGAVLAPTDPVFASALVGNKRVPHRLRHLLNVESGINDGLALPFVIILLSVAAGKGETPWAMVGKELLVGIVVGILVPLIAITIEKTRFFKASHEYEALNALAIGLLVFAISKATHGNLFLAAFAAGVTVATIGDSQKETFEEFGELISEVLKLAALLVFGALITPTFLGEISVLGWVFALAALFVARPIAIYLSFIGTEISGREQLAAAWFGPKGFASVVYGLLVLTYGLPDSDLLFHLIAVTVVLSILLHSSTDVVVAKWFDSPATTPHWHAEDHEDTQEAADERKPR